MAIPFFTIVIEKIGDSYTGYTPNLSGVVATGSREFVEQSVIEQISKHLDQLSARHAARGLQITTALIDEKVFCLFR